jgi:nicotinamide-nucleotide amidase
MEVTQQPHATSLATIAQALLRQGAMLATAESCTGGLIAAACTDLAGASAWFERGFVSYSNAAKQQLLGVDENLIASHGAVSEEVARAMAHGAAQSAGVAYALATTGVAGPDGGSPEKPVGTVCFAYYLNGLLHSETHYFQDASHAPLSRNEIRWRSVAHALGRLALFLQGQDCRV